MSKELLAQIQVSVQNLLTEAESKEAFPVKIRLRTRTTRVLLGKRRLVVVMEKDLNKPFISNFGVNYFREIVEPKAQRPFALFLNGQDSKSLPSISVFMVVDLKTQLEEVLELAQAQRDLLEEAWFFMETSL